MISGRVSESGRNVGGSFVLVFPDDPLRWYAGSRFSRLVPTDAAGEFTVEALPPETYRPSCRLRQRDPLARRRRHREGRPATSSQFDGGLTEAFLR
jgi:hypothetical protein